MSKLILPAQIHPPRIKRDGSASLTFDTRELSPTEYMMILGHRNTEGWLAFQSNEEGIPDMPEERAELDSKTPSERLRAVLFVWYKQESDKGNYVGTFEAFRAEKVETIIETIKRKLT